MKTFQHRYESPEGYLHHRAPYLMVEQVVSISDTKVVTQKQLSGEEFFIAGHFPGAPILPGAMMQEMSTQSGGILIAAQYNPMQDYNTGDPDHNAFALGVLVKVMKARFRGFARPGHLLTAEVVLNEQIENLFDFSAILRADDAIIMQNQFQLTNIPSAALTGR